MKILKVLQLFTISMVLLGFINLGQPKSLNSNSQVQTMSDAVKHLKKYGFLEEWVSQNEAEKVTEGLQNYQKYYKLSETGQLNTETIRSMNKLRCGNEDVAKKEKRQKRFAVSPYSWTTPFITWSFLNYSSDLSKAEQIAAFEYAFDQWSKPSKLIFTRVNSGGDIVIFFKDIDGENGVLGLGSLPKYPNHNVSVRFDEGENWTTDDSGAHLSIVACHEIGHALGLLHSQVQDSIMFAQYIYRGEQYELHMDDNLAVKELYDDRETCISGDGIVKLKDGRLVTVSNLNIGDAVQISENNYSPVLTMLDKNNKTSTLFIQIKTNLGNSLKLTPKHLIAVQSNLLEKEFVFAEKLQKGSKVYVHIDGKEIEDEIVAIEKTMDIGYYAPLTNEGTLIVNGIEISCYALIEDQELAHISVTPLRWFLQLYETIFKRSFDENPTDGIHWYGRWSYNYILPIAGKLGFIST